MSMSVNKAGNDDRVAKCFDVEFGKPRDDLTKRTKAGNAFSLNRDSTVLDRCNREGNDPTRRIDSRHLAGEVS